MYILYDVCDKVKRDRDNILSKSERLDIISDRADGGRAMVV